MPLCHQNTLNAHCHLLLRHGSTQNRQAASMVSSQAEQYFFQVQLYFSEPREPAYWEYNLEALTHPPTRYRHNACALKHSVCYLTDQRPVIIWIFYLSTRLSRNACCHTV